MAKLSAFVESHGCTLEYLIVNDRFIDPRYEVCAPEGKRFNDGTHWLICIDAEDVRDRLPQFLPLEDCPEDCTCKE